MSQPKPRHSHQLAALSFLVVTLVAASCGGGASAPSESIIEPSADIERAPVLAGAKVEDLAAGFTDAGFDLLRTQPADTNLIFSPLSIGHALLMARAAADDSTGDAIDSAFGLPTGNEAHEAWNALDTAMSDSNSSQTALDGSETPVVTISDRLWPSTEANPSQEWIDLLATYHGVDVETIDVRDPEGSRKRINSWISDQTNALIPELVPPGFIRENTVLVLTDTIYFKADWQNVFGKYGPETGPFTRLDGSSVDLSYLVDLEQSGIRGVGDGYSGAEIPYLGNDYTMLLIIPEEGRFDEVRQRLSQGLLDEIDNTFSTGPYELRMPKWETTSAIDLLGWLTGLGIAPGAYPAIGPDVFLAGAVHGADVTVDENGTVAAAATALGFNESGPPEPELVIAAERPFFYVVRHVDSGAVLFAGQVIDPTN